MSRPKRAPRLVVLALAALATLTACAPATVEGSEARVAVSAPLTSFNADSSFGRASLTNLDVAHLTGAAFATPDAEGVLVPDSAVGRAEIVEHEPLIVRYTLANDIAWSDGVHVTATDLLLTWAANSGVLNDPDFDPGDHIDPETGRLTDDYPEVVYFDGRIAGGIEHAIATPQLVDDHTLLVRFEQFIPNWANVLAPGLPAHVVAAAAGIDAVDSEGGAGHDALATAVADAILERDRDALAAISRAWNLSFDLAAEGAAQTPPPAAGPYRIESATDEEVVLVANPTYTGVRVPAVETLRLVVSRDARETVDLIAQGRIDVATLPPEEDLVTELASLEHVSTAVGLSARAEHLDLRFAGGRSNVFADARVREAFLLTVPRERIVEEIVQPVAPDAQVLNSFTIRESDAAYGDVVTGNGSDRYAAPALDRARALLAEAEANNPEVCILFDANDEARRTSFELIAEGAAQVGFRVSDCSRDNWEDFLGVNGAYDAAIFSWDTARLGREAIGRVFHSTSAVANLNGFANADADAVIDELLATDDADAATELLAELDALIWSTAYGLPLYTHPTLTAIRDTVENVTLSPLQAGVLGTAWQWHPTNRGDAQ